MQCRNSSRCAARSTNDGFRSQQRRVAEERDELAPLNRVPLKLMHRMQHAWRAPRFMMRKSGKPDLGEGGGEGEPLTPHRADGLAISQGSIPSNSGLLQGLAGRCVAHLRRHLADRRLRHGPGSRCCNADQNSLNAQYILAACFLRRRHPPSTPFGSRCAQDRSAPASALRIWIRWPNEGPRWHIAGSCRLWT